MKKKSIPFIFINHKNICQVLDEQIQFLFLNMLSKVSKLNYCVLLHINGNVDFFFFFAFFLGFTNHNENGMEKVSHFINKSIPYVVQVYPTKSLNNQSSNKINLPSHHSIFSRHYPVQTQY